MHLMDYVSWLEDGDERDPSDEYDWPENDDSDRPHFDGDYPSDLALEAIYLDGLAVHSSKEVRSVVTHHAPVR